MAKLFNWLKSTSIKLLDPNREQILAEQTRRLEDSLYQEARSFDLDSFSVALGILPEDIRPIAIGIYRRAVERAWLDDVVTDRERRALDKIARLLHVSPTDQRNTELSIGLKVFERALTAATADEVLDERDGQQLGVVAASLGTTTRELILNHFADEGEGIVRSLFASVAEDGATDSAEWDKLVRSAGSLGLHEADVRTIVRAQAEPFIEHVLTEAKADGVVNAAERRKLDWLLSNFELNPEFREYVNAEIQRVELLAAIAQGHLPSLKCEDVGLRAGEIVHLRAPAVYVLTRQLQSGPRRDQFVGDMVITDCRTIFTSPEKTIEINHRRIADVTPASWGFELRSSGKGSGGYYFDDAQLAYAILRTAVGRANQTIVSSDGESLTRRIPRDVRQRVWQRYGGRCSAAAATERSPITSDTLPSNRHESHRRVAHRLHGREAPDRGAADVEN